MVLPLNTHTEANVTRLNYMTKKKYIYSKIFFVCVNFAAVKNLIMQWGSQDNFENNDYLRDQLKQSMNTVYRIFICRLRKRTLELYLTENQNLILCLQTCLALKCPYLLVYIMLCTSRLWNGSDRFAFDHIELWWLYNIRECLSTTLTSKVLQIIYVWSQTARGGQIFP